MSWLFSRALGVASSEVISSDGALYVPSSATPTPRAFSLPVKTTDACPRFRSGMTCERLTADRGEAVLTWCLEASLARVSAPPGTAPDLTTRAPASGQSRPASLAKYDPATSSWRTAQCSLLGGLDVFSQTWPRWGTMRDGECWGHATPARPTNVTASGSWLTPTKWDRKLAGEKETKMMLLYEHGTNVPDTYKRLRSQVAARNWPTQSKSDADGGPGSNGREGGLNLRAAVRVWPTPTKHDHKDCGTSPSQAGRNSQTLPVAVGGQMNPTWVEWLMGWPLGWTDLRASATDRFRQWCDSHGNG
jgi:DNA (cytosine-5)-methyltransferase 1